jgi:murein DD-endopeptidase MepM/ murein hydrolase activator NlpD
VTATLLTACAGGVLFAQWVQPVSARSPSVTGTPARITPETAPVAAELPAQHHDLPDQPGMELSIKLRAGDTIERLLTHAGAGPNDAARAEALIASALPKGFAPGAVVTVRLGTESERRTLLGLTLRAGLGSKLAIISDGNGGLRLQREDIAVDSTPLRFRGRSGAGLYWSMRAHGVPAAAAAEFVAVLAARQEPAGQPQGDDRFDLVVAHRRAATGETQIGSLLYAGLDRHNAPDIQLVNAAVIGRAGWFDAASGTGGSARLIWPVAGRISSHFGTRFHPILRFARFHSGVDVSASWGSPIVAAADGYVIGAGWNGGHGRQIRISHQGGLATSYSHLSRIVADPGSRVWQGQVIGYVGSTGFSTGPHLHYEVHEHGRAVDPARARHSARGALSTAELATVRARLRQLLAVDGSRMASVQAAGRSS